MFIRVTTYKKHKGRYVPITDRMEPVESGTDRLDMAFGAAKMARRFGVARVLVGAQAYEVGYIDVHMTLKRVRWDRPLLPQWRVTSIRNNDQVDF